MSGIYGKGIATEIQGRRAGWKALRKWLVIASSPTPITMLVKVAAGNPVTSAIATNVPAEAGAFITPSPTVAGYKSIW
jgi:hypothetical protein